MKIIDFEKRGNLVRFYLGDDNEKEYSGAKWTGTSYDEADRVYDQYIKGHIDIVFPMNYIVLEPNEDYRYFNDICWSKKDLTNRLIPCVIAVPIEEGDQNYFNKDNIKNAFLEYMGAGNKNIIKFYYEDPVDSNYISTNEEENKIIVWNA